MIKRWVIFSIISVSGILLDQATKLLIDRSMSLYQSIPILDNFFHITYVRNPGAAFSFMANSSWRLPFFIAVSIIAAIVIIIAMTKLRNDQTLAVFSFSMIFSGAVGNLIDRIRMGEVIDFLDAHWYSHHWPAFNVADSLICVGVFMLALDMFREDRKQKTISM